MAAAAKGAVSLQRLNLNTNQLGAKALTALAEALRLNPVGLQELAVSLGVGSQEGGQHVPVEFNGHEGEGGGTMAAVAGLLRAAAVSSQLQLLDIRGMPLEWESEVGGY